MDRLNLLINKRCLTLEELKELQEHQLVECVDKVKSNLFTDYYEVKFKTSEQIFTVSIDKGE
jgi:hypothetical protein